MSYASPVCNGDYECHKTKTSNCMPIKIYRII